MKAESGQARDRKNHLQVTVNAAERAAIEQRAAAASLSISAYLRTAGMGKAIRSTVDRQLIDELGRVNGDQGRLGGLLKLWLADSPGRGASVQDVRALLRQVETLQGRLALVADRL
jgi:hypothetical protein